MPTRGIRGTGLLRHVLKASSPVERLIICSPGRGPMMPWMPGCRGRGWPPRSVVIISRARRGTGCWVCYGLGALGRRYAPTAERRTSGLYAALLPESERVLGPEHPDTLRTRAHLGSWTAEAGDSVSARDIYAARSFAGVLRLRRGSLTWPGGQGTRWQVPGSLRRPRLSRVGRCGKVVKSGVDDGPAYVDRV
jgi:hypothetical protein